MNVRARTLVPWDQEFESLCQPGGPLDDNLRMHGTRRNPRQEDNS